MTDLKVEKDICYKIALALTPGMNAEIVRTMTQYGISFRDFFTLNMPELAAAFGNSSYFRFQNADREEALFRARREVEFIERHSIQALFLLDDNYPVLLREIPDAPIVLFKLGNADLDASPALNIVGTRRCTAYGTSFCQKIVSDLAAYYNNAVIVSGLAYGIDAAAHMAALENNLTTVAVVAHGLDMVYPAAHRDLAKRIIQSGGAIVSEYPTGTRPYRQNFLQRNRIIAGLCELTFVVESEIKGGAMSTANQAFSYGREVMALPGRYTDRTSQGCNMLIERNKASIFTTVAEMMNLMRWKIPSLGVMPPQRSLFPELEGEMAAIYNFIKSEKRPVSIDEIHVATHMPMPTLMSSLTDLEFEGIVLKLPGSRYEAN